jgi:hypothetical protein
MIGIVGHLSSGADSSGIRQLHKIQKPLIIESIHFRIVYCYVSHWRDELIIP